MPTITFRNTAQLILWKEEITGQISDGHWENARPHDHYKAWCSAIPMVGDDVGRDFYVLRDYYGLTSPQLMEVVRARMLVMVRLGLVFGIDKVHTLMYLFDAFNGACPYRGMPEYTDKMGYWDGVRRNIEDVVKELGLGLDVIAAHAMDSDLYNRKMLRKDLLDMRKIMQTEKDV